MKISKEHPNLRKAKSLMLSALREHKVRYEKPREEYIPYGLLGEYTARINEFIIKLNVYDRESHKPVLFLYMFNLHPIRKSVNDIHIYDFKLHEWKYCLRCIQQIYVQHKNTKAPNMKLFEKWKSKIRFPLI